MLSTLQRLRQGWDFATLANASTAGDIMSAPILGTWGGGETPPLIKAPATDASLFASMDMGRGLDVVPTSPYPQLYRRRGGSYRIDTVPPAHELDLSAFTDRYDINAVALEKWFRNFAQGDKWNFCLTAGTLVPANQERP
jgi:hypothetical protein